MATTSQRPYVVGVFDTYEQAEHAMRDLIAAGFAPSDIGFAMRKQEGHLPDDEKAESYGHAALTRTTTGAVTGGVLGTLLGAISTLLIPGFGPVIGAGMLVMAAGGAVAGGFAGLISTMQLSEDEMRYYEGELRAGRPVVVVRTPDRYSEAMAILSNHEARDVNRDRSQQEPVTPPL
jgi:hypothetical protein